MSESTTLSLTVSTVVPISDRSVLQVTCHSWPVQGGLSIVL